MSKENYSEIKTLINMSLFDKIELDELTERRLYINSPIDESIIDSIVFNILKFNREDRDIPSEKRKPVLLYINTPGGSVVDGFGLIDVILCSETPIYTINQALCASMGFLIFLAGEKRYSMPRAEFLMHDGSGFAADSTAKMKDRIEFETNQLEKMVREFIIGRTNISEDLYEQKYRVEWYMLPKEAQEYGIVTDIVGQDCTINDII
jgi:ATP-dependent Clp protease protease subunit